MIHVDAPVSASMRGTFVARRTDTSAPGPVPPVSGKPSGSRPVSAGVGSAVSTLIGVTGE